MTKKIKSKKGNMGIFEDLTLEAQAVLDLCAFTGDVTSIGTFLKASDTSPRIIAMIQAIAAHLILKNEPKTKQSMLGRVPLPVPANGESTEPLDADSADEDSPPDFEVELRNQDDPEVPVSPALNDSLHGYQKFLSHESPVASVELGETTALFRPVHMVSSDTVDDAEDVEEDDEEEDVEEEDSEDEEDPREAFFERYYEQLDVELGDASVDSDEFFDLDEYEAMLRAMKIEQEQQAQEQQVWEEQQRLDQQFLGTQQPITTPADTTTGAAKPKTKTKTKVAAEPKPKAALKATQEKPKVVKKKSVEPAVAPRKKSKSAVGKETVRLSTSSAPKSSVRSSSEGGIKPKRSAEPVAVDSTKPTAPRRKTARSLEKPMSKEDKLTDAYVRKSMLLLNDLSAKETSKKKAATSRR